MDAAGQAVTERQQVPKWLMPLLKIGVAAALIIWLLRTGQLNFAVLARANPQMLLPATFLQAAMIMLPLLRWHLLVRARSFDLSCVESLHIGLIGNFLGIVVPSGIGADGIKAAYLGKRYPGHAAEAISTVIVDRLLGLSSMLLLGLLFGLLLLSVHKSVVLQTAIVATAVICLCVIAVWIAALSPLSQQAANLCGSLPFVQRLINGVAAYKHSPAALSTGLLLSAIGHMSGFMAVYVFFVAIGSPVELLQVAGITPIANLSALIPITPLGLGVSDSISAILFSSQNQAHGADINMLSRLVTVAITIAGGLSFLVPVGGARKKSS
jgi:glycosyltransferase 2 family protein